MKAAILLPCLLTGGTEIATLETAITLRALGFKVEVLVYFQEVDDALLESFTRNGIVVRCLDVRRAPWAPAVLGWRLLRALGLRRYSVIWVQYMTPTLLPLLVARLHTGRLIAAVHVAAGHYSPSGLRRLRWLARWWCDRFVCVSHTTARGIFGSLDTVSPWSGRVAVLPNALDMTEVEAAPIRDWRGELGLPTTAGIGGYVGRLAHNKGVDILIRAAALLHPSNPHFHWIIVGNGGDRAELESLASELGVDSVMHFVGAVTRSEVFAAFKGFEVAVVPSREEGFGLSALEAMACGIPVACSNLSSMPEIAGEAGVLFDPHNEDAISDALRTLLCDTTMRKTCIERGIVRAAQFTWRKTAEQTLNALRSVAQK